ncbi:MAG: hypothetical protein NXI00_18100 [Cytophagales bacterium]|nr:hypothetical protein [Cytophagales bacterium]
MAQYYLDPRPFLYEAQTNWEQLLEFIKLYGQEIDIVHEIFAETDKESRETIIEFLHSKPEVFLFAEPKEKTISMSPFLTRSAHPSVIHTYDLTQKMIDEIDEEFIQELNETCVTSSFVIRSENRPIVLFGFHGLIVQSEQPFIDALNAQGFELMPWEIPFNEISYGIQ